MSMSPIAKDFCPNNWFEVDKEVNQEGFCKQLSWKCCFVCICLPVCYPCYLTRTVRYKTIAIFSCKNSRFFRRDYFPNLCDCLLSFNNGHYEDHYIIPSSFG